MNCTGIVCLKTGGRWDMGQGEMGCGLRADAGGCSKGLMSITSD